MKITADDKQIVALSPHFKYKKTKELTTIDLMGLNVELNADDETSNDEDVPTQIFGYNSALMIPKYKITLPFKYYNAKLASRNIEFDGKLTQGEITLKSTNSEFSLHVENSSDQVLNKLLNKNIFEGGTFNLDINGKDSTNLSGHFHFNQTHLAQLKSYNNLIAFINTIPSLLFMKNAGFNESGIEVTKGDILFSRENDLVTVHNITLNGVSTDIVGGGIINLKDETMHFNLQIKTLKALSDTISKIPIVNYILLGDNQTLSTGVEISGSMSDPVVKTQVLQDTLSKPFDVIKNTIMLPFKIFQ